MHRQNLGEMLVAANLIDEVQMQIALAEQKQTGKRFGSTLVELKFIDENVLAAFLSKQIDVPCISLLHVDIPKKVLRKLARTSAIACKAVPVRKKKAPSTAATPYRNRPDSSPPSPAPTFSGRRTRPGRPGSASSPPR